VELPRWRDAPRVAPDWPQSLAFATTWAKGGNRHGLRTIRDAERVYPSAMERARATWTDARLDDLAHRIDDGFNRVDEDLRSLRIEFGGRIDAQGAQLGGRIDRLEARIDARGNELRERIDTQGDELRERIDAEGRVLGARIDAQGSVLGARIDALQRTMIQLGGAMTVAILATLLSVIATRG
jgi:hypothetical protein